MAKQNIISTKVDLLLDPDAGAQADPRNTIPKWVKPSINRGATVHRFLILIFSIFIVDAIIMLSINALPPLTQLATILLDASLLLVVMFPILYFFVFRPLMGQISERNRAEETLVILKKAIYTSGEAIFLTDREGVFTFANPAFTSLYGYSSDEILGKATPRIIKSGALDKSVYEVFWQTLLNGDEVRGELINKKKDGTLISTEGSATPIFDTKKNIIGFLGIQRDIAERKRAEEMLLTSEKLYHSLFENMLNGFAYCQMHFDDNDKPCDFTYLSVNSAFETLTRLKNVVGKKVTEVIPGIRESDPELLEIYGRVSKTGKPEQFEIFVGSLQLWFNISVYSPEQGCFVAVFDVITKRKQAEEEALKNTLPSMEAILESIHNGILVVSDNGTVIKANAKFAELWRIPDDILASGDDKILLDSILGQLADPDGFIAKVNELYGKPEAESLDEIALKDGRLFNRISNPLYLGRELKGRVWSFLDITERKLAEKAFRESEARYKELSKQLEAILDHIPGLVF